uniref:CHK domain-containing protein n=1 Tax=Steinernema glaseri TaxID=37863 RepID=A0A1I7Y0Y8_9BILA
MLPLEFSIFFANIYGTKFQFLRTLQLTATERTRLLAKCDVCSAYIDRSLSESVSVLWSRVDILCWFTLQVLLQVIMLKTGSTEWLIDILKAGDSKLGTLLKEHHLVKDDVAEIGAGKGMVSNVYNHVLHLSNGEIHSVVVKIPGGYLGESQENNHGAEVNDCYASRAHNRECELFNDFPQLFTYLPTPYVYLAVPYDDPSRDPVIALESLVGKAEVGNINEGFNSHQVYNIAKDLAKFQSIFLTMEDQSWVEKYPMNIIDEEKDLEFFRTHFEVLKDFDDGSLAPLVTQLAPILYNVKVWRYTSHAAHKHLGIPAVMCNDDTWINNILWKLNEDGSLSNHVGAYIDWQLAHAGCLTVDLVCVLALCTKPSFQREHQYKVLRYFYDLLVDEVKQKGGKVEFSFDQVKKCYNANFVGILTRDLGMQVYSIEHGSDDEWTLKARRSEFTTRARLMLEQVAEFVKELPKELME